MILWISKKNVIICRVPTAGLPTSSSLHFETLFDGEQKITLYTDAQDQILLFAGW